VTGPMEIASACALSGARFIYASSHSVYGHVARDVAIPEDAELDLCSGPLNPYARSKLQLDMSMAEKFSSGPSEGLEWIGLRCTNVFGTGEHHKGPMASIISQLLRQAACGGRLRLFANTLEACRDYIPV